MCLPVKSDQASGARSIVAIGAVLLLACLAGPLLAGAGVALLALTLCFLAPALMVAWRAATRQHTK